MTVPGGMVALPLAAVGEASAAGSVAPSAAADEIPLKNRIEPIIRKRDNTFRNSFRVDPLREIKLREVAAIRAVSGSQVISSIIRILPCCDKAVSGADASALVDRVALNSCRTGLNLADRSSPVLTCRSSCLTFGRAGAFHLILPANLSVWGPHQAERPMED